MIIKIIFSSEFVFYKFKYSLSIFIQSDSTQSGEWDNNILIIHGANPVKGAYFELPRYW